jgi:phosphoglucomutase
VADIDPQILERAKTWTTSKFDEDTRKEVQELLDQENWEELTDRFYQDLEFGTGGMRGVMGAGTNRMNVYTVRASTQGFANHIKTHGGKGILSVVIGHDCRKHSREFALEAARVMAGNSIRAYLFDDIRATPQIAYAVRHLKATAGIILTASHNPAKYNGYKAYWSDGAQVIPPHDKGIIAEVQKVLTEDLEIKRLGHRAAEEMGFLIEVGEKVDAAYFAEVKKLQLFGDEVAEVAGDFKAVYTPLHGVGSCAVPRALKEWGFDSVEILEAQREPDGSFPTVKAPNPEESENLKLSMDRADEIGADLVLATDADSDRLGVALRPEGKDWVLLTGNQIACLLLDHVLAGRKARGTMPEKPLVISTIVTSPMMGAIAESYGCEFRETLTGFKWIAAIVRECEEKQTGHGFLFGAEESFGYLTGDYCRDKDGISATCLLIEAAALARTRGETLLDVLDRLYLKLGFHMEGLQSFYFEGRTGKEKIASIMDGLRKNPPSELAGRKVIRIDDVLRSVTTRGGEEVPLILPQSNVLLFSLEGGGRLAARPSGTEPKIKFYSAVRVEAGEGGLGTARTGAQEMLEKLKLEVDAWVQ